MFAEMVIAAARAIREVNPELKIVLGGISPIDPNFVRLLDRPWRDRRSRCGRRPWISRWIGITGAFTTGRRRSTRFGRSPSKPVWVSEAGASSFGAEEVQVFGIQRTAELLLPMVERVHWYSLFDLPATWTATTRHKEAEGSAYYRHYYMGLLREDGTRRLAQPTLSRRVWGFASGFISKIIGWNWASSGCGS